MIRDEVPPSDTAVASSAASSDCPDAWPLTSAFLDPDSKPNPDEAYLNRMIATSWLLPLSV